MPDLTTMNDDEVLAKILAQEETGQIAASLGLEAEEYAQRVLHYLRHPNESPNVQLMSDEEAREAGMPSVQECVAFLDQAAEDLLRQEQAHFDVSDEDEKSSVRLTGGQIHKKAPRSPMTRAGIGKPSSGLRGQGPKKGL